MHYSILVPVEIQKQEEDVQQNIIVQAALALLRDKNEENLSKDVMREICIDRLCAQQNTFSRNVVDAVEDAMAPYSEGTENPDYLEFWDQTDEVKDEYENDGEDCVKTPDGRIVPLIESGLYRMFVIHDGKVYQRYAGACKQDRRTKKAKKYTALPMYPYKKLYSSYVEYATEALGYVYNNEEDGYGYYSNPNAFWDWYVIGGRWPKVFLVKDTCEEYAYPEKEVDEKSEAPEGYMWVCGARKKDIAWDVMKTEAKRRAIERYEILKKAFEEQKMPEDCHGRITDEGIVGFTYMVYVKGESLEEYLHRQCLNGRHIYPPLFYGMLKPDGYYSKDDMRRHKKTKKADIDNAMCRKMDDFINSLDGETVLVGVDIHM